jgi:hypothetical protein
MNLDREEAKGFANAFGYQIGSMPFTYLGLPMGTTKPEIKDMSPLVARIERRLSSTHSFISYGDRLVMVKSVLFSPPTFFKLTLMIPVGIVDVVDRARRHCLWRKKDKDKIHSLATSDMVCKPKKTVGLGIINLRVQNATILMKLCTNFIIMMPHLGCS